MILEQSRLSETVVIVGAGHAAGQCVAALKQKKHSGEIILIGEEPWHPYQRPPLSKKYLAGELDAERLFFKPVEAYAGVDVRLDTRVTDLDVTGKSVRTDAGDMIAFDKLVLATGSQPRQLSIEGCDKSGVHYLRNIADVDAIRSHLAPDSRIVIVGAGYIGLEVAAVAKSIDLDVTVIESADRVMKRVVSEQVSAFFQRVHEENGVKFLMSETIARIEGNARVEAVSLQSGGRVPADQVIVGIGVAPNVELAARAGLQVSDGIVVDEHCRASAPDIFAIGDCTKHPNPILGRSLRLESVHNALEQAKVAAANICGDEAAYAQVPWFWSDQYDLKLQIAGISEGFDDTVIRGDMDARSFACFYLKDERLLAVDAVNRPRAFVQSKALIAASKKVRSSQLADTSVMLKDL